MAGMRRGSGVSEIYIIPLNGFKFSWLTFIHLKFTTLCVYVLLCITDYTMDKSRIEFQGNLSLSDENWIKVDYICYVRTLI